MLRQTASHTANSMLNVLFPPQCLCCHTIIKSHGALCNACWENLHFISAPMCSRCSHPFEYELGPDALCASCIESLPAYESAYSLLVFDETSKILLHQLKYEDQAYLAPVFAAWVASHVSPIPKVDMIIPVPLSRQRLWKRRYNQSALVAKALADKLDLPYRPLLLTRIKHTQPQIGLTRAQRVENVRGAFKAARKQSDALQGKTVWLVDDVMTTGATLHACVSELKRAGVSAVHVLTLARVIHTH